MDAIANNLANVGTTAYKRSRTASQEFAIPSHRGALKGVGTTTRVDFNQGDILTTGHSFDLALSGPGFFALDGPNGEVYTRDGQFELTEDGVLVNEQGLPVTWDLRAGAIDPSGLPIVVDPDGAVRQGPSSLGNLKVVDFENHAGLRPDRNGNWVASDRMKEVTSTAIVHQYSLEQSNSVGTEEIIEMIGVQRSFESTANLIQSLQRSYARLTRSA